MRLATWNVNSLRVRLDQLGRWARDAQPDVVCLQETKCTDDEFPHEALQALGYEHRLIHGQKTYNGVAILSKHPLTEVQCGLGDEVDDPQARMCSAVVDGVRVVNCYVPNGGGGPTKFTYKLAWLSRLTQQVRAWGTDGDLLVCGDMNVAPDDPDVWDPFEADGKVLFHPAERQAIQRLLDSGLVDAWRQQHPTDIAYSWWDYRGGSFRNNQGFRIDHVFVSEPLLERVADATIWRDMRKGKQPSDHVPVTVDWT